MDAHEPFLFALFALQNGLVNRDNIALAFTAWLEDKSKSIVQHLTELHLLNPSDAEVLQRLMSNHINSHANNFAESLAKIPNARELLKELHSYASADDEVFQSLATLIFDPPKPNEELLFKQFQSSDRIGPYKLLQQVGEGGMGTVWMAEQEKPIRRRVALKLIKAGIDDHKVIARFDAERQALSMMDHPNIARVLDVGTTATGQPYFVMELVQGVPLNQYCDKNQLTLKDRLSLFIPVCQAVQHAHQKGVIHRDIKPTNVLVAQYEGKAVPKVIDFGLAKALQHQSRLTDKTMFTEFGQVVGTLQYMSPEQAELNALDIDTRTDIYSLGIMLYELLTGTTPIDIELVRHEAILKVLQTIREVDPQRPSARLSSVSQKVASGISQQRRIEPQRLQSILRGELDWIVMKAIEKDRSRRYGTASDLAEDIKRYLNGDPVQARPPSLGYRFQKFARKNLGLVTSLVSIFGLLLTAVIGISWFALDALHSREVARELQKAAEEAQSNAQATTAYLTSAFQSVDPDIGGGEVTVAECLRPAEQKLFADKSLPPKQKIHFASAILEAYLNLNLTKDAERVGEQMKRICDEEFPNSAPESLLTSSHLATAYWYNGKLAEAVQLLETTAPLLSSALGETNPDVLSTQNNLALMYLHSDRPKDAEELFTATYAKYEQHFPEGNKDALQCLANLVQVFVSTGRSNEGIQILRDAIEEADRHLGPTHTKTLLMIQNLSEYVSDPNEAENLARRAYLGFMKKMAKDHPDVLTARNSLIARLVPLNKWEEAVSLAEESDAQIVKMGTEDSDGGRQVRAVLMLTYMSTEKYSEAVSLAQRMLRADWAERSGINQQVLRVLLAFALVRLDRKEEAVAMVGELEKMPEFSTLSEGPLVVLQGTKAEIALSIGGSANAREQLLDSVEKLQAGAVNPLFKKSTYYFANTLEKLFESEGDEVNRKLWAQKAESFR